MVIIEGGILTGICAQYNFSCSELEHNPQYDTIGSETTGMKYNRNLAADKNEHISTH